MESLRTRKASVSRPKAAKPAAKLSKPSKDARKSRVDDKIKKRMSMRYADISGPTGNVSIPSVPALPIGLRPGPSKEQEEEIVPERTLSKEDVKAAENQLLDADTFDPDACALFPYVARCHDLTTSYRSKIKAGKFNGGRAEVTAVFSSELQRRCCSRFAAECLQEVSYQCVHNIRSLLRIMRLNSYSQFVHISKEIGNLENELLELKESLAEWKSMPSLLHIDESASVAGRILLSILSEDI